MGRSLCLIVVCVFSGCRSVAPIPTDSERSQTVQLLDSSQRENLVLSARRKVAILCAGARLQKVSADANRLTAKVIVSPGSQLHGALAVGIDRAGYFLTAAHMTERSPITLIFHDGVQMRVELARVVATIPNPSHSPGSLDLALLQVPALITEIFEWSDPDEANRDRLVVQIGEAEKRIENETNLFVRPALAVGRIQHVSEARGGLVFDSELPARLGDSGGPLLTKDGKLIAIHSGTRRGFSGRNYSVATRPSAEWLSNSLAADKQIPRSIPGVAPAEALSAVYITVQLLE